MGHRQVFEGESITFNLAGTYTVEVRPRFIGRKYRIGGNVYEIINEYCGHFKTRKIVSQYADTVGQVDSNLAQDYIERKLRDGEVFS